MNNTLKKLVQTFCSLLFWLGLWAIASFRANNTFILPSPLKVIKAMFALFKDPDFLMITAQSLGRIFIGVLVAILLGIILAVITVRFSFINTLITPFMSTVKATPVASFIFIAIIFMSRNVLPAFITVLLVLPIIWTNISSGIRSTSKELLEVTKVYKFSPLTKLTRLYIPTVLPYFLAACRSSLGMAWKAGVAAEVLCTPTSAIGTELYFAKTYMDTEALFAWTLITIILSLIIEKSIVFFISRFSSSVSAETEVRA